MAEGDGTLYRTFKAALMTKDHDLGNGGDELHVTLHDGYSPSQAHADWADVSASEYSGGSGYTAGGKILGSQTVAIDTSQHRGEFDTADATWDALGPLSPATPSDAILWNTTPTAPLTDPLIGYWELGTTATNGGDYTLQWGGNGLILLT